jgi:hypothetical protein
MAGTLSLVSPARQVRVLRQALLYGCERGSLAAVIRLRHFEWRHFPVESTGTAGAPPPGFDIFGMLIAL